MNINLLDSQILTRMETHASGLEKMLQSTVEASSPLAERVHKLVEVLRQPDKQLEQIQGYIVPIEATEVSKDVQCTWQKIQGDYHLLYLKYHLTKAKQKPETLDHATSENIKSLLADLDPKNLKGEIGRELFFLCISTKRLHGFATQLVEKDLDINGINEKGDTAWHYMAFFDRKDLVERFWDKQTPNIWQMPNQSGKTPIDAILAGKAWNLASLLVDKRVMSREALEKITTSNAPLDLIQQCIGLLAQDSDFDVQSIYNEAIKNGKNEVAYTLFLRGAKLSNSANEKKFHDFLISEKLLENDFFSSVVHKVDAEGCRIIDALINIKSLPLVVNWQEPMIWKIFEKLPGDKQDDFLMKVQANFGVTLEMLQTLKKIAPLSSYSCTLINPLDKINLLQDALDEMQPWLKRNEEGAHEYYQTLCVDFEEQKRTREQAKKWIEYLDSREPQEPRYEPGTKTFKVIDESGLFSQTVKTFALELALNAGRYDLVSKILPYSKVERSFFPIDNPVFQFLLDKLLPYTSESDFKKKYIIGGKIHDNAIILEEALRKAADSSSFISSLSKDEKTSILPLIKNLQKALTLCAHWGKDYEEPAPDEIGKKITTEIEIAPLNTPILIPTGNAGHQTVLAVQKTSNETASVYFYNTGQGLRFHPQLDPSSSKFQTYLAFDEVPLRVLRDPLLWKRFIEIKKSGTNIQLYEALELFSLNGVKRTPSTNPFDYEQAQMQGTCSAQCLMAFLRHQLLQAIPGSTMDKFGFYKFLKAHTLKHIADPRLPYLMPEVLPMANRQLARIAQDVDLLEIAKSPDSYAEHIEQLFAELKKIGHQDLIPEMQKYKAETTFGRFGFLRHLHSVLAQLGYQDVSLISSTRKELAYTQSLISKKIYNRDKLRDALDMNLNAQDWNVLTRLFQQIFATPENSDVAVKWMSEKFPALENTENNPFIVNIARIVQKNPSSPLASKLLNMLGEIRRLDLVELLKTIHVRNEEIKDFRF